MSNYAKMIVKKMKTLHEAPIALRSLAKYVGMSFDMLRVQHGEFWWVSPYLFGHDEWSGVFPMFIEVHLGWPIPPRFEKGNNLTKYRLRVQEQVNLLQWNCMHLEYIKQSVLPSMGLNEKAETLGSVLEIIYQGMVAIDGRTAIEPPEDGDLEDVEIEIERLKAAFLE